jgi:uncharacterized protein (TIGR03083 family)
VEPADYIAALETQGNLLASIAERAPLTAAIPTCPGWRLRDLLRHLGGVHRWAGSHIRDQRNSLLEVGHFGAFIGTWPPDDELPGWYRGELILLVESLRAAPADLNCATFLKSVSPLVHWTRRQAHEVTIHRADAESITGELTPVSADFGADGIDELLSAFVPRRFMKLRSPEPVTMTVAPTDSPRSWRLTISHDPVLTVENDPQSSDCTVTGSASDLYFDLWNRGQGGSVAVSGNPNVRGLFRDKIQIKWA